jgi:hypothetical protein
VCLHPHFANCRIPAALKAANGQKPPAIATEKPIIVTFRDWLLVEAASDMRQLRKSGWTFKDTKQSGD